jgi:hypothetical protein
VSPRTARYSRSTARRGLPGPPGLPLANRPCSVRPLLLLITALYAVSPPIKRLLRGPVKGAEGLDQLGQAKILITNFHAFQLREKVAAGKITKSILADGQPRPFTETPDQMPAQRRFIVGKMAQSVGSTGTRVYNVRRLGPRPRWNSFWTSRIPGRHRWLRGFQSSLALRFDRACGV